MFAHPLAGPTLLVTSPYGEFPSHEWACWLVVLDMEGGIPQITPATALGLLGMTKRPRRLGVDGQCVRLTPAEPNRCENVILQADDLSWKKAKPWFDAVSTARLMYPTMRTVWRLREQDKKRWMPNHEPAIYTDWKCEIRLDTNDLKDRGFASSDPKVRPNWARVWNRKPKGAGATDDSPGEVPAR